MHRLMSSDAWHREALGWSFTVELPRAVRLTPTQLTLLCTLVICVLHVILTCILHLALCLHYVYLFVSLFVFLFSLLFHMEFVNHARSDHKYT